jgi:N-acetylmuramoyl-L-alanine amidase-like protein
VITLLKLSPYTGDLVAPSPNQDARNAPAIEGIVLHATADDGEESLSLSWLRSTKSRVSCHLLVNRAGRVTRLVGDRQRAWHAGLSWWKGTSDVNSITLGIEIANRNDGEPFTDAQYRRVASIVAHYCKQGLSLDDVVGHNQIAQGRKTDPLGWNWNLFRAMVQDQLWPANVLPNVAVTPSAPARRPPVVAALPAPVAVADASPKQRSAVKPKHVLQSRTLWLNAMTVLAAGGMLAGDALDLARRVGINPPEDVIKWALFAVGVANIILRLQTSRPLTCTEDGRCTQNDAAPSVRFQSRS